MIPAGMDYVAKRDITTPGNPFARAYSTGHRVHRSAVEGPDAWLILGQDVDPVEGADVPAPPRNAPGWQWASFLGATAGIPAAELDGMGRDAMLAAYDKLHPEAASQGEPPAAKPDAARPDQAKAKGGGS